MTIEISNLGSHTGKPANTDLLALVDVSDTTQAASGSTKKVSYADLVTGLLTTSAAASTYQPLDSDLTALAALTTTSFGRSLLELADAAAGRTALELGTAAQVDTGTATGNVPTIDDADARYQPIDSDLTAIAALTTSAFGRSLLESADAAAARTLIDVDEAGTAAAQVTAHTDDATDAHDASAISVADAGDYFTSTDVEGALQEAGADIAALSSGAVSDGDKGDITVSGSGATWTIDDNAVSLAKLADIATASILGRTTAATGDPEVLTATQVRSLLNVEDGATADQSAAEILTAIKTVDGTSSGLDADLLDGNEATAFATEAQGTLADSAVQPGDTIPIVDGGTGAQSAAVARTNLSVYSIAEVDAEIDALSDTYAPLSQTINDQTGTTYTLVLADAAKVVRCANASAITLTVPPNSSVAFPVGTRVDITQSGAGALTVAAGAGVTINKPASLSLVLQEQWSQVTLVKVATDTWDIAGDLTAA